ncbi:TBC1 domain family member 2B isoform X2 [Lemur catta]|uniref:TBC1 domain family member 2B isoform X2 n=1 Tax=Lemur catta TaxID=9447 RepID=UPI001E2676E8|nr:TBC1 domain family member 2B isoform X2 [Lemur catta]
MPGPGARAEEGGGGEGAAPGAGPGREPARLCGYLQKLSGKGPLRGYRSRWFVFDARRCYLYYFKSPQDALPLGHLDIADACFSYQGPDEAAEPGAEPPAHFQVHSAGAVTVLKAPNRQLMTYWLQELQQKRWEYCNNLDMVKWDSRSSPTPGDFPKGLVARDNTDLINPHPNASAEKARNVLAVETVPGELVGEQAANQPAPGHPNSINFYSLKQWGNELKNSMSSFRPGRGHSDSRKTVFYTSEEWELLDPTPKDLEESMVQEEKKKPAPEVSKGMTGSGFPFEFGRNPYKGKRPLKDIIGSYRNRHSSGDPSSEGTSGGRPASETQLQVQSQQEELEGLKKELSSQKELVRLLQQTVRSSQYDRYFASGRLCEGPPRDTLELLRQKDEQILGLAGQLERLGLERDGLQQEVRALQRRVGELSEQLGMLMETIQAKDEVIIKLSESEAGLSPPAAMPGSPPAAPASRDQLELDRLKDNLQGYKTQNKFLNKEILELSALRRNAERRERNLMAKYSSLEAKLCQIESKYLILLQEMKTPVCSEEQGPAREVIAQLLEDALQVESQEQPEQAFIKPHLVSEYDIYGFRTVPEDDEEEKLVARVRALDLKTLYLTDSQEVSTGVKWENYFASTVNRDMMCSPELKNLVRAGIPHEHRSKVWKWCVDRHTRKFRDSTQPGHFQALLQKALEKQNPASKQIELDLLRTLPNNKHYSGPACEGVQKLRNVLLAFSWRNPDIGYCQGLNRLAAVALLYLEQEDAFWCLVAIVEVFMPRDYYTKTLLGSQVDQRVFRDLLSEKLPRLHAHFEQHKVDYTLITFNWFLVVFVDSVVSDILFKIWDSFLYEGPKVIFRFALALFKYKEEEILKVQDSMSIFKYLRSFTRTVLDARPSSSGLSIAKEKGAFEGQTCRERRILRPGELRASVGLAWGQDR